MRSVLVINSGSSSVKYQLVDLDAADPAVAALASGIVERIGEKRSSLTHNFAAQTHTAEIAAPTHQQALEAVLDCFDQFGPVISESNCLAVGHRVVQGGAVFPGPALVTDSVLAEIRQLSSLAPLHNPANALGIEVAQKLLPDIVHVVVFDSSFFVDTLEPPAYTYALERKLAEKYQIRRYGAHGTSHQYVGQQVAEFLDLTSGSERAQLKQIVLHIGNGASVSAQIGSAAVDTSMGLTPLEGLVMGTRTGDLDPAIVFHLARQAHLSIDQIDNLFNKQSGMLGLTGQSDMRSVQALIDQGDPAALLARQVYVRRIAKYIGSYYVMLGGCDAITFTAGVGENDAGVRADVCAFLKVLGVELNPAANAARSSHPRAISSAASAIKVLVIPTNEELAIARLAIQFV
jgi:acetate kinase